MATYIVLTNFTDQGVRTAKDTGKRLDAVKEQAKKFAAMRAFSREEMNGVLAKLA